MQGVIYGWYQPQSNKWYIGQTTNIEERKKSFMGDVLYSSSSKENMSKIDYARHKYGTKSFQYYILYSINEENVETLSKILNEKEIEYIKKYNSYENGYNTSKGGNGVRGYKYNESFRERCRQRMKGEGNPFYGKHHSKETKELLSKIKKGDIINKPKSTKEIKPNPYRRGIKRTEEVKQKCCINQPTRMEIIGIDPDGNTYHFNSAAEAARKVDGSNQHIIRCCKGHYFDNTRKKYINMKQYKGWKFHFPNIEPTYIEPDKEGLQKIVDTCHKNGIKTSKPIDVYDLDNNFIETMPNQKQCAIKYNCNMSAIARCCKGGFMRDGKWVHSLQCKGYVFRYHNNN